MKKIQDILKNTNIKTNTCEYVVNFLEQMEQLKGFDPV